MTNVESIKQQIAEMESKLNELNSQVQSIGSSTGDYVFTHDEMLKFMNSFIKQMESHITEQIEDLNFGDDYVSLDLYDKQIEVNVDSDQIVRDTVNSIDFGSTDDSDMVDSITNLYYSIKTNKA